MRGASGLRAYGCVVPPGAGAGADLLSHEATFSQSEAVKAGVAMHSTAAMAGAFAAQLRARHLVLTHFSARYGSGPTRSVR